MQKIGATKPILLDSGSPRGEGESCVSGHGLLSLYSSYTKFKEKTLFSLSNYQMQALIFGKKNIHCTGQPHIREMRALTLSVLIPYHDQGN